MHMIMTTRSNNKMQKSGLEALATKMLDWSVSVATLLHAITNVFTKLMSSFSFPPPSNLYYSLNRLLQKLACKLNRP